MLDTRKGIYIWRSLLLLLLLILVLIFLLLLLVLLLLLLLLLLILSIVFWLLLFCNNFSSCKINVRKGTLKAKQLMEILVVTAVTISCDSVINHSSIFFLLLLLRSGDKQGVKSCFLDYKTKLKSVQL